MSSKQPPKMTPWGQPLPPPPPSRSKASKSKKPVAISSAKLQAYDAGMGALKKTPFQLKKEAEEEKRLKAEAEAAAALAEYESSFGQDSASSFYASRTSAPAFVKSGSHSNPGSVKKDFAYTPAPVPSPPVARAGLYSEGNAVQPPLPRQGFGQKKAFTIQLNRSKPSASPSAYNVPSIPGLNYQGNSAIQSQSLPGLAGHQLGQYSQPSRAGGITMQVPRKIGLSAFQQLESKTPVPAKQQQSSGRTAEDPRKAKWRAAYLASQQEEDADEYEREEKAEKGAEAYLQGVLEQENCTDQNEIVAEFEDSVTLKLEGLPEDINEESLCRELAIYGPIASVKLVPGLGSALVAYMRPIDANTAREKITTMFGTMIYVSKWRPIRLPKDALYDAIPERVNSGLPFNAQPANGGDGKPQVLVTIPKDKKTLATIHLTISYVIKHGPGFEASLKKREDGQKRYEFLWNHSSLEHIYYRWKLYSLLQGDSVADWRRTTFAMYDQGPVWVPPTLQFMEPVEDTDDAEDADSDYSESDISSVSSFDSDEDYDKLEEVYTEKHPKPLNYRLRVKLQKLLQRLTLRRSSIAQALVFCMIYSYGAEDLIEWVLQSLLCHETPLFPTKLARFYLLSDLLYNSANSKANVWRFRALLEPKLSGLFYHLGQVSRGIPGRLRQDQFRQIFMATLEVWGDWALFPRETLAQLEESYQSGATREESFSARLETQKQDRIGLYDPVYIEQDSLVATKSTVEDEEEAYAKAFKKTTSAWVSIDTDSSDRVTLSTLAARDEEPNADLDGNPMEAKNSVEEEDDDIDGIPFTITSQSGTKQVAEEDVGEDDEDIDGVPFTPSHKQSPEEEEEEEEDLDGVPFVRSQEDEEDEDLDGIPFSRPTRQEEDDDDIDGIPLKRPPSEEDDRTDFGDKVSFKPMLGIKRWKGRMDLSTASDDEDATE